MLADLRRTLIQRYGHADERVIDGAARRAGPVVVGVRFHVITSGELGRLSKGAATQQVATLNAAYGGKAGGALVRGVDTGVTFRLDGYDVTTNAAWFKNPQSNEKAMKTALHRGGAGTLNLYAAAVGADVLGFSTFPQWNRKRPAYDGVVIDYRSVPGGEYRHFDQGFTAVHEVGHWLGLFHTFENGCDSPGDGVTDTPDEAVPTEGCPWLKDTCQTAGYDPVHNFMDYGWDDCMHDFTAGQARRIRTAWGAYRAKP